MVEEYNKSKATSINPKDLVGSTKVSISKLSPLAIIHGGHAMMDGADKYGPYNYRDKAVQASVYVDAAIRHILSWFQGEQIAADSEVHHLGHAIACCAILIDAEEFGKLVDDRPIFDEPHKVAEVLERLSRTIKRRTEEKKAKEAAINPPNIPPGILIGPDSFLVGGGASGGFDVIGNAGKERSETYP